MNNFGTIFQDSGDSDKNPGVPKNVRLKRFLSFWWDSTDSEDSGDVPKILIRL